MLNKESFCTSAALTLPSLTHSAGFWAAPVSVVRNFVVDVFTVSFLEDCLFCFLIFQHISFSTKKNEACIGDTCSVPLHSAVTLLLANLLINHIPH